MKQNFKLFFDMDDTIVDFTREDLPNGEHLLRMNEKGYFENLKPLPFLEQVNQIAAIMPENVYIISACIPTEYCMPEKINWLKKYLPNACKENIIFLSSGENKAVKFLAKFNRAPSKYDILIDDYSKNIEEWELAGGTAIKFLNRFNDKKNNKYKYKIKNLKTLMNVLDEVRKDLGD